jgi:flagellar motility protein MotE (MotC chaperone)
MALHEEVKANSGGDDHSLASERARLEKLAADIEKAREALKQETARLEVLLKGDGEASPSPAGGPETAPGASSGSAAARDALREQIVNVSKAMKGMKPEQAGAIVSHLDRVLAAEVLRRMRPADAGLVLAQIKPDLAAELATTIAIRRPMIDDGPKKERK